MPEPLGIEIRNLYKIFGPHAAAHVDAYTDMVERQRITEAFRAHHDREVDWAGGLTESEQAQLVGLLDKLVAGRTDLDIRRRH